MQPISPSDLDAVHGGVITNSSGRVIACTPDNPSGAQPQTYVSNIRNANGTIATTPEQVRQALWRLTRA